MIEETDKSSNKAYKPHSSTTEIETERRLTRNEHAIEDLDGNVKSLSKRVGAGFQAVEGDVKGLRSELTIGNNIIVDKINDLRVSEINDKKTSWPLILKVVSLVFAAAIALVGWGMSQQKTSAVNAAVGGVHHAYQAKENKRNVEWNLRQNDRGNKRDKEIALIQKNYYEHREGIELEQIVDKLTADVAALSSKVAIGNSEQIEDGRRLAILEDYSMTSMKDRSNHTSQLKDLQIELGMMRKTMLSAITQLGQLEPLTKDMGLSTVKGVAEKLKVIENQVNDLGNKVWQRKQ